MARVPVEDTCKRCGGRGYGNWEPDHGICYECGGKGSADYYIEKKLTYLRRWLCTEEGTPAKFSVRIWMVDGKNGSVGLGGHLFLRMRIRGTDRSGNEIDRTLEGDKVVGAAWLRFSKNRAITKMVIRDDLITALHMNRRLSDTPPHLRR